ncbi:hypothetical protein M9H77_07938 [Catharanthus roseus]|uniref:Uncharacterized protein n=1 Tax=Catharanthus roseus TaxID=4058 RepID=A0ACC0BWC2_CATRO|nr:hypothetical protein M9H77_07938 [Catharanthus roseus]
MIMQFHKNSSRNLGSLSESSHISAASTPECKETCNATVGLDRQGLNPTTSQTLYERSITKQPLSQNWSKQATGSWGTYQVCPGTNLNFKPLLALYKAAVPPQSMMRCPRRPIGPHLPRSTPFLKWIHSPESESSMPSEEDLVRGTSYVQCNPLALPNTRS